MLSGRRVYGIVVAPFRDLSRGVGEDPDPEEEGTFGAVGESTWQMAFFRSDMSDKRGSTTTNRIGSLASL